MSWLLSIANAIGGGAAKATTPYGSPMVANKTRPSTVTAPKTTQATSLSSPDQILSQQAAQQRKASFTYDPNNISKDINYTNLARGGWDESAYRRYAAGEKPSPLQQFGNMGGSVYALGGDSLGGSYGDSAARSSAPSYDDYSGGYSPGGGGYQGMVSAPPPPMPSFTAKPPSFSRIGDYQRPDMPKVNPTDMEQAPARYQRNMAKYRHLLGEVVQ